jgi:hypothetical protein
MLSTLSTLRAENSDFSDGDSRGNEAHIDVFLAEPLAEFFFHL